MQGTSNNAKILELRQKLEPIIAVPLFKIHIHIPD